MSPENNRILKAVWGSTSNIPEDIRPHLDKLDETAKALGDKYRRDS